MGFQIRLTLVLDEYSPLLAPLMTEESTLKTQPPKPTEDKASGSETPIQQVTPLLGTTPRENLQLQHRNSPDDISDVLGTRIYQGYVETPLQTLDGIVVNQPKRFLPLAEEAKCLAEEIRIENANCLKLFLATNYASILKLVFSSSCSHGLSGFLVPRRALLFWGIFVRGFARRDLC